MIISGTGHRPDKLVPASMKSAYSASVRDRLKELAIAYLRRMPDTTSVVSGMALGWDTGLALAALELDIPLVAAIPFVGLETRWNTESQALYKEILKKALRVEIVSPGGYSAAKMQTCSEWMVDNSDSVLALWNGSKGGTGNCMRYAESRTQIQNCWSSWVKYSGFF